MAKFQGDRSRELGERVAKKKHLRQNISPSGTVVPGGLIIRLPILATFVSNYVNIFRSTWRQPGRPRISCRVAGVERLVSVVDTELLDAISSWQLEAFPYRSSFYEHCVSTSALEMGRYIEIIAICRQYRYYRCGIVWAFNFLISFFHLSYRWQMKYRLFFRQFCTFFPVFSTIRATHRSLIMWIIKVDL